MPITERRGDRAADDERPHGLRVAEREGDRKEKGEREVLEERADEVERGADVDARPPADPAGERAHARQYPRVSSTATGMISSRPSHISPVSTTVERSLNGA